ncbi:hypothetical protein [Rhodopseudomonas pseudopalustris]|nr:hypothetical protein [Rhodopseudomonas pseudopalustris]
MDGLDGDALQRMRLFRTILALMIAISLAALPVGSSAMAATGGAMSGMAAHDITSYHDVTGHGSGMSAVAEPCHQAELAPNASPAPAPKHDYKCPLGFCCVGSAAALGPTVVVPFKLMSFKEGPLPAVTDRFVPSHAGSRLFRPPRA